jgi:hypothetical protein
VITTETLPDGSVKTVVDSYYEKLEHRTEEVEKQLISTEATYLQDVITCLGHFKNGSAEVSIKLKREKGDIVRITKRWQVTKESYGRR